jgi:uncharacterized protein (TIGR02118 family)
VITTFAVFRRKPGLTSAQFSKHWRDVHAPLIKRLNYLRGYVQNHRWPELLPSWIPSSDADGVAQFWWDSSEDANRPRSDPEFTGHGLLDEPRFLDPNSLHSVERTPIVLLDTARTATDARPKLLLLLMRDDYMPCDAFTQAMSAHWAEAAEQCGAIQATLHLGSGASEQTRLDAVVELWWQDADTLRRWVDQSARPAMAATPGIDASRSSIYPSSEHVVIPPP